MKNKLINTWLVVFCGLLFMPLAQAQADWVDISPSVEISKSAKALDRVKRVLFSYVTIKNTSGVPIEGPLYLKIIDPSIPVINADGISADFKSYIQIDNEILESGAEKTVRVDFQLARAALSFDIQIETQEYLLSTESGAFYNPPSYSRYITRPVNGIPYIDGGFVVIAQIDIEFEAIENIANSIGAVIQGYIPETRTYQLLRNVPGSEYEDMAELLSKIRKSPEVLSATLDHISEYSALLDDFVPPEEDYQNKVENDNNDAIWDELPSGQNAHLEAIEAVDAWRFLNDRNKTIGGNDVWIGVIDSPLDFSHEDLDVGSSIFYLAGEKPATIDDNEKERSHGTFVTGIIGASWNGKGIAGILEEKKIIHIRAGGVGDFVGDFSAKYKLIELASSAFYKLGQFGNKQVINISFGQEAKRLDRDDKTICQYLHIDKQVYEMDFDSVKELCLPLDISNGQASKVTDSEIIKEYNAWLYGDVIYPSEAFFRLFFNEYSNALIVQAAGNHGQNALASGWVCSFEDKTLKKHSICVSAINEHAFYDYKTDDYIYFPNLTFFSNAGKNVDIAAPGKNIHSTVFNSDYVTKFGTSFSAPIVTGIAGLIWNAFPELSTENVKKAIIDGSKLGLLPKKSVIDQGGNIIPIASALGALICAEKLANGADTCLTLSDDLVAYYSFGAETAADDSGNGHDGIEQGGVSYVEGISGQAASFDRVDDFIIANGEQLSLQSWTISGWIRPTASPTADDLFLRKDEDANDKYNYGVILDAQGGIRFQYDTANSDYDHTIGGFKFTYGNIHPDNQAIPVNTWGHFISVRNAQTGDHKLYINGKLASSGNWMDEPVNNDADYA